MSEIAWLAEQPFDGGDPGRDWTCEWCGSHEDGALAPIHLDGLGDFCSPACADAASEHHAAQMDPRR